MGGHPRPCCHTTGGQLLLKILMLCWPAVMSTSLRSGTGYSKRNSTLASIMMPITVSWSLQ